MTAFLVIISLDSIQFYSFIYRRKTPVYFCTFRKTSAVDLHLKLHKCGIDFPTTKGLHKGDMSRNWQWFYIEIAQWKVKLLWLC